MFIKLNMFDIYLFNFLIEFIYSQIESLKKPNKIQEPTLYWTRISFTHFIVDKYESYTGLTDYLLPDDCYKIVIRIIFYFGFLQILNILTFHSVSETRSLFFLYNYFIIFQCNLNL